MKVLACDDRAEECEKIVRRVSDLNLPGLDVEGLSGVDLKSEIDLVFKRVSLLLGDKPASADEETKFDHADLVLLDNNLAYLPGDGVRFTAESVIGYIRAFTNAGYIVSLNKNPDIDFDLRFLIGDYSSRADLSLNYRHVSSSWLWIRERDLPDIFSPWYWPTLTSEPSRRRKQIEFVKSSLQRPILEALHFPPESVAMLSRHALGALSPDGGPSAAGDAEAKPASTITFRDMFAASSRAIPDRADREKLLNRANESDVHADVVSRAVAADVDFWIRRDVIGPQDVLVDAPHLLTRMPFLLGSASSELTKWNSQVEEVERPYGLDPTLFDDKLSRCEFDLSCWVRSPSFWWSKLIDDDALNRLFYQVDVNWVDAVFCEDISRFVDRKSIEGQNIWEFVAEFEGPWERRYVKRADGYKYSPRSRFAL